MPSATIRNCKRPTRAAGNPLPTLAHPTFLRIARGDEPLALKRGRRSIVWVESDAPDGYLSLYENARLVVVDPTLTSITFVRASDFRAGRARLTLRTALPTGSSGEFAVRKVRRA